LIGLSGPSNQSHESTAQGIARERAPGKDSFEGLPWAGANPEAAGTVETEDLP